jgi:hypothetical protein
MADCLIPNGALADEFKTRVADAVRYTAISPQDHKALLDRFDALGPASQKAALDRLGDLKDDLRRDHPAQVSAVNDLQSELRRINSENGAGACLANKLKSSASAEGASKPLERLQADIQQSAAKAMECKIDAESTACRGESQ